MCICCACVFNLKHTQHEVSLCRCFLCLYCACLNRATNVEELLQFFKCFSVCVRVCFCVCVSVCLPCVCECVRGRVLAECAAHWARAQLPICRLLIVSPCGPFSPLNASVLLHFNELFSLSSIYNPIFWEILLCICEMRSNRTQINIYKIVISLRRLYTTCS